MRVSSAAVRRGVSVGNGDACLVPVAAHLEPHRHPLCCGRIASPVSQVASGVHGSKARMSYAPLQLGRERTLHGWQIRSRCRGSAGRPLRVERRRLGRRLRRRDDTRNVSGDRAGRGRIDDRRHDENRAA